MTSSVPWVSESVVMQQSQFDSCNIADFVLDPASHNFFFGQQMFIDVVIK